jgi:hypothetical protein
MVVDDSGDNGQAYRRARQTIFIALLDQWRTSGACLVCSGVARGARAADQAPAGDPRAVSRVQAAGSSAVASEMAAKARAEMLAGVGAIGKRRKAWEEALRRAEADARAGPLGQAENNASATSPPGDNRPSENNGPIGSPPVRYPG